MHTINLLIANQSSANKNLYDATYVFTSSPTVLNFGGNKSKGVSVKTSLANSLSVL
jgi:hypothetical protein